MPSAILDGLSAVDATGYAILASTAAALLLGVVFTLFVHRQYARLGHELERGPRPAHPVLTGIVHDVEVAARASRDPNVQAIIESRLQSQLKPLLLAERFVRGATGLVIILGLLGTFYGLTLSIGRLVHLVAAEPSGVDGVTQTVSVGLTRALSGMAVAFSNSLFGITSAVILTILGILANVTDRRLAFMVQIEAYVDQLAARGAPSPTLAMTPTSSWRPDERGRIEHAVTDFREAVTDLRESVARFESALHAFSTSTRDFQEFNAHLKDNIQRMSLSFGDLSETLKASSRSSLPQDRTR